MGKYLDSTGLSHLITKIKDYIDNVIQSVGAITGVKGDAEATYRVGNVNLTAANIGAAASSHTHAASDVASGTLDIARIPTGTGASQVALGNHTHDASDITSGTLDLSRIPTGTGASQVALGSHTHDSYMGAASDGTYYGLATPAGATNVYIRGPQTGFIPYQSGGSGYLGTSSWPWNYIYGKNIYQNGTKVSVEGHSHGTGDITSGTLADARLPTKGSAGTAGTSSATSGATLAVPYVTTDAYGRVTAKGTHTHTIGSLNASAITAGTLPVARGGTGLSTLGSYTSFNFSSQSVANATATDLKVNGNGNAYFTFPSAGVYFVKYSVWFSSNSTGRRLVNVNTTSKDVGVSSSDLNAMSAAAVNGAATKFVWSSMTFIADATEAATKRYVSVYQNSGGALNCAAYVRLFKIANGTS